MRGDRGCSIAILPTRRFVYTGSYFLIQSDVSRRRNTQLAKVVARRWGGGGRQRAAAGGGGEAVGRWRGGIGRRQPRAAGSWGGVGLAAHVESQTIAALTRNGKSPYIYVLLGLQMTDLDSLPTDIDS